jgi:spore photoproduct lyase
MSSFAQNQKVRKLSTSKSRNKGIPFAPERVWIDATAANHPQTIRILNKLPDAEVDVVDDVRSLKRPMDLDEAKRGLVLTMHRGEAFKPCQGIGEGHLCCNYRVMDLVSGCPMDCSYCILQSYLANNPTSTAYVNVESILAEVSDFLQKNSAKFFRIGTGELGDSLALDQIVDFASILIPFFASKRNAILELKTKSALVDHILDLRHRNRTVISWSVNTPAIIASEEHRTASLDERLEAAKKVSEKGFGVGFHFDPIIITNCIDEEIGEYLKVIDLILENFEARQISWISLGLLRYPKDLPRIALKRFPNSRIYTGELVPTGGKMRYLRFIREKVYKPLWDRLVSKIPVHKLYMCMETEAVWEKVDPTVKANCCIEKRLCNMENIAFDYRSF